MFITILEARVASEYWQTLRDGFAELSKTLPPTMRETFLVQDEKDKEIWRIVSVWQSRSALDDYRKTVEVPEGLVLFRKVQAKASFALWDVMAHSDKHD